jgi:hypothetical protein
MVHVFALLFVPWYLCVFVDLFAMLRCGVGASFFLVGFRQLLGASVFILCRSVLIIMAVALPMVFTMFLFCSLALSLWWFN